MDMSDNKYPKTVSEFEGEFGVPAEGPAREERLPENQNEREWAEEADQRQALGRLDDYD
jgi:hypothetical protein